MLMVACTAALWLLFSRAPLMPEDYDAPEFLDQDASQAVPDETAA